MSGATAPQLIIDKHQSAHHFAFKPSHMRRLQQAQLVIWIDRHFEAGFNRVPEILPDSTRTLELMPLLGIDNNDGHFWYSPSLLQKSVGLIRDGLVGIDPGSQSRYRENAKQLIQSIDTWRRRIQHHWRDTSLRVLTDHDFLTHFEGEFKQFEINAIHDHHDARGGLGDLGQIEQWLSEVPAACLLTLEPEASPLATSLASKYRLDIVRVNREIHANTILQRLEQLQLALETCAQQAIPSAN